MKASMPRILVLAILGVASGCSKTSIPDASQASITPSGIEPLPQVDTRSPDSVVKSWWAYTSWMKDNEHLAMAQFRFPEPLLDYLNGLASIGTGDYAAVMQKNLDDGRGNSAQAQPPAVKRSYQFDILEVKNESETRAVVLAKVKNNTPIPAGIELSELQQEDRDYGRDYKFVVEKTAEGWRLSQGWYRDQSWIRLAKLKDEAISAEDTWQRAWEPKPPGPREASSYDFVNTPYL